ncbi:MAG: HAD family phosphatase [Pseudoxanthomonas sp.]
MSAAPLPGLPQALVFDMDGLLLDSERAILGCFRQAAHELGLQIAPAQWLGMVGHGEASSRAMLDDWVGAAVAAALLARARALYHQRALRGIPLRPGVVELLDWLDARRLPRAIATSTRRELAVPKLQAAGLLHRFDALATSSDVARPKPAPDVYLLAARLLAVAPAGCLVLEDSPTGVRAALAAGMTPVQVPDLVAPDAQVRALGHRIVASLDEVRALLQALADA